MISVEYVIKRGIYQHKKGRFYFVIDIFKHTEKEEKFVAYVGLYKHEKYGDFAKYVRPLEMFLEEEVVSGKKIKRFQHIPFEKYFDSRDKVDNRKLVDLLDEYKERISTLSKMF